MGCCCSHTEQHDSRQERITALPRTIDEAQREPTEPVENQDDTT